MPLFFLIPELAIQTEGYMDVKIVDIETGEKLYILKSGKDRRLKNSLVRQFLMIYVTSNIVISI